MCAVESIELRGYACKPYDKHGHIYTYRMYTYTRPQSILGASCVLEQSQHQHQHQHIVYQIQSTQLAATCSSFFLGFVVLLKSHESPSCIHNDIHIIIRKKQTETRSLLRPHPYAYACALIQMNVKTVAEMKRVKFSQLYCEHLMKCPHP